MLSQKNIDNKFYYPICTEKGCEGCLKIKINECNFTIDSICEKNKCHKKNGLLFQTFENFYLKEKHLLKCYKCYFTIENSDIYKCSQCNNFYCINCFFKDEHIEQKINNLIINSNKCSKCNKELSIYCLDCGEKTCDFCLKEAQASPHENHQVEYILESLPTNKQIDETNNKINEKIKKIEEIIELIDKWCIELMQKIEKLKTNLKKEIIIIEKIYKNFNPHFTNYIYYNNFNDFKNDKYILNNKFLEKFRTSYEFEEKTKNIFQSLFYNVAKTEDKYGILKHEGDLENGIVTSLDESNFLIHYDNSQYFDINYYNYEKKSIWYYKESRIDIKEKIYSVTFSKIKNKIYVCLKDQKIIKIYDYIKSKTKNELKLNEREEEIKDFNSLHGHFNKCIYLINNYCATADDEKVSIWHENISDNSAYYSNISNIELSTEINDLLLVDNNYFCCSQNSGKSVLFVDNNDFTTVHTVSKINCVNSYNCLFLVKNFIVVNCIDGICIISAKTHQLVQFIQNFNENENKKICLGHGSIYVLDYDYHLWLIKLKLYDGTFVVDEKINLIYEGMKKLNELYKMDKLRILFSNHTVALIEKNIYVLKDIY